MIIQADANHIPIASGTVQCVVTSPPYWGLRDYGIPGQLGLESTPEEYVANMVAVFREVRRVMRSDATLWLNIGDSYASGPTGTHRNQRDPKSMQNNSGWTKREQGTSSTLASGLKPKDLCGIPWRLAFALQADGWWLRSDIIWHKPNPMPESVTDRPTKSHEYLFLMAKSERYFYDADAIAEPVNGNSHGGASISSIFAVKNSQRGGKESSWLGKGWTQPTRNKRSVWTIATQPYSGSHFATFPEKLVETCLLAGSRPGDIVFDPFVGSGTVIRVATRLQRKGVGCDLNFEYLSKQATRRTSNVQVEMHYPAGDPALPAEA